MREVDEVLKIIDAEIERCREMDEKLDPGGWKFAALPTEAFLSDGLTAYSWRVRGIGLVDLRDALALRLSAPGAPTGER